VSKNIIEVDLNKLLSADWIQLAQETFQWRVVVNTTLLGSMKGWKFID
jgi:hypothetical protein